MIRKLRRRFIRIALIALTAAMVLVAGVVNAANWVSVRRELTETLNFLSGIGGPPDREDMGGRMTGKNRHARNLVGESRWFAVTLEEDGTPRSYDLINMPDMTEDTAAALAARARLSVTGGSAFEQDYLYTVKADPRGGRVVIFLDCETRLTAVRTLALISLTACVGGFLLAWLFVTLASRKAIEPTIRNMEQQKQFITNASHELKTPLTVISTNMELMEMERPGSQWVRSTQRQTAQMRHLVDEMVYLSRMEEENAPLQMETVMIAPLLRETADPFLAMAEYQGKTMTLEAEDGLAVRGDRASLERLLSTLLDNAVKYASGDGNIIVRARAEGRHAVLTVANDVPEPLTQEQCRQLFDRFYRADPSRNKDKQGGFGIGLAIAAAIVEKHGGSITAGMEDGRLKFTCRMMRSIGRP